MGAKEGALRAKASRPRRLGETILLIEDEEDIQEFLCYNLQKKGYRVQVCGDGEAGLKKASQGGVDLILLDIMLPKIDGFAVCQKLRALPETKHVPIIILTAKSAESDTVQGLDLGADDYMSKPFNTQELLARIKGHLRRHKAYQEALYEGPEQEGLMTYGPLSLDRKKHMIFLRGQPLLFTLAEFKLLASLLEKPEQVFSRSELLTKIAGGDVHLVSRNVDVHILAIRRKLGDQASMIQTIRGVGYKCQDPSTS